MLTYAVENPNSALLNGEKPSVITNSVIIGNSNRVIVNDTIGDRRHTFRLPVITLLILLKIIEDILVTMGRRWCQSQIITLSIFYIY